MVVAPRSETEHRVAALWAEVLGRRPSSIDDEFITVGGDPPRARQLLQRIAGRWAVEVTLQEFLVASSIAGVSATIDRKVVEARTRESDLLSAALEELEAFGDRTPSFE